MLIDKVYKNFFKKNWDVLFPTKKDDVKIALKKTMVLPVVSCLKLKVPVPVYFHCKCLTVTTMFT